MFFPEGEDDYKDDSFDDELCNQCIERITYLQELLIIEEERLSEAMKIAALREGLKKT